MENILPTTSVIWSQSFSIIASNLSDELEVETVSEIECEVAFSDPPEYISDPSVYTVQACKL